MFNIKPLIQSLQYFRDLTVLWSFNNSLLLKKKLLKKQLAVSDKNKKLLAVYDFLDLPYTSDIAVFLINADAQRRINRLDKMDVVFIFSESYPVLSDYHKNVTAENQKQFIHNMALEYCRLFPFVGSILVFDERVKAKLYFDAVRSSYTLYPSDYNPNMPFERLAQDLRISSYWYSNYAEMASRDATFNSLRANKQNKLLVCKWLEKYIYPKFPITITLREVKDIQPQRKNSISDWQKMIDHYKSDPRIVFVVLRDYSEIYSEDILVGENVIYCNEAVVSLSFRAALHELSLLNLFIPNGVNVVSFLSNKCAYIQFKMLIDGVSVSNAGFYKKTASLQVGQQWHGANQFQRIVWRDDLFEVIVSELQKMLAILEQHGKFTYHSQASINDEAIENHNESKFERQSLMDTRPTLKTIMFAAKVMNLFHLVYSKYRTSIFCLKRIKAFDYSKDMSDRNIVIYGAGSGLDELLKSKSLNILAVVDKNPKQVKDKYPDLNVVGLSQLSLLAFDFIIITPKLRQIDIADYLVKRRMVTYSQVRIHL